MVNGMFERLYNYRQMSKLKKTVSQPGAADLYPALQITNGCNKQCEGCLRSANSYPYNMSATMFEKYIGDLQRLGSSVKLKYQFVTGGEPTIWKSGNMDIVDALVSLSALDRIEILSMPTNGKNFEDIHYTREFCRRLSSARNKTVIGISISKYQDNLDESGYIAMDNLLSVSRESGMKVIPVILVTLSSDDDTDIRLKKIYPGVTQRVVALAPLGDADNMEGLCPSLPLTGNSKEKLGSFLPYFRKEVCEKTGIREKDFDSYPNAAMINILSLYSHCGDSPFVDDKWHYCLPLKDDPEYNICGVGEMNTAAIPDFFDSHPILKCIRVEGVLSAIEEHSEELNADKRAKLDSLYSPETSLAVAYRGCMVCRKMYDYGIIKELNDGHSSSKR